MSGDFVFLSTIAWEDSGGAHRPVQFARELAARGNRVLFVEIHPSRALPAGPRLTFTSLAELGLSERAERQAWFGREPEGVDAVGAQFAARLDAHSTADPHAAPRAVIWCAPYIPFVRFLNLCRERGFLTVYDCLDDFQALAQLGYTFSSEQAEKCLVAQCDLTLAVSPPLVAKLCAWEPTANVQLLRSGYDAELYAGAAVSAGAPRDLLAGECTLGFWGVIADWTLDVEALEYVARARPRWSINLIGRYDPEPARPLLAPRLRALPNVRLVGPVPQAQLPRYLAAFDVCLIPFARNPFNAAREPLKVFQYLAGLKPVVALNAPQLEGMPSVYAAHSREEFLEQIERARATPVDGHALRDYLATCTWSARTDQLLDLIAKTRAAHRNEPAALPSFYPEPDLPENWRVYLAHLDQLLDERTAYIGHMEREWQRTQAYVDKLERTHPLVWLKRRLGRR